MHIRPVTHAAVEAFEQKQLSDTQVGTIEEVKEAAAQLWDRINDIGVTSGETQRLVAIAKTNLETTVLFATKAISRQTKTNG